MSVKPVTFKMPVDLKKVLDEEAKKISSQRGTKISWTTLVREVLHQKFMTGIPSNGNNGLQT